MSSKGIAELPPEIGQLGKLQELYLPNNQLKALPTEISKLANLRVIHLQRNQLKTLPPEIGNIVNLQTLHLGHNQLTDLPKEIGQLGKLETLDIGLNELHALPPQIGLLSNLKTFIVWENQLQAIPPDIGQMTNLQDFNLWGNKLTALPPEIGMLKELKKIDLRDNSLPIPPEILAKIDEPEAIITWYLANVLSRKPKRPLNEAKVILVGQGAVGKTSLVKRLLKNEFDPDEQKTEGIDIQRWPVKVRRQEIRLNIWDFGGQEIMHATHQFFLTKRSLYLLVLDSRLDEAANRLEYWLKMITAFGEHSPVIVVCNKSDQGAMSLNWHRLQEKYPNIKEFIKRLSCRKGTGLNELRRAIVQEISELEHVRDQLAENWFEVKERLTGLTIKERDYLPYEEYVKICEEEEITAEASQTTLISYIHDLGIALHFPEHPLFVLNPEWVTQGVYQILNSHRLFQKKGVLHLEDLKRILPAKRYPQRRHGYILDLMKKFELLFEFPDEPGKYLVPDLLPKEEPYTGVWEESLHFQYHYDVLPGSVLSRLIVNLHKLIHQHTYWRTGVVFQSMDGNNLALARGDLEDRKIYLWVSGEKSTRPIFLEIIKTALYLIHDSIPGLKIDAKIPAPGLPTTLLDYSFIKGLVKERTESLPVPGPDNTIQLVNLTVIGDLYNIGQAGAVGREANAHNLQFQQISGQTDFAALAGDLEKLKNHLKGAAETPEQLQAVADVAAAEKAAKAGNGPKMLEYLKKGGAWALDAATKIGTSVAAEVIKKTMGY